MEGKVKVVINDMRRIPTIGKGPVRTPIFITNETYNLLKLLGYNVQKVEEIKIAKIESNRITEPTSEEPKVEEKVEEEIVATEETVEETIVEEEATEEVAEEVVEEATEETVEEETKEVKDIDGMTKAELKAELDALGVEYAYSATVAVLRDLLKAQA